MKAVAQTIPAIPEKKVSRKKNIGLKNTERVVQISQSNKDKIEVDIKEYIEIISRLAVVETKIDNIEKRIDYIDKRIDNIDKRIDYIDKRIDNIDKRIDYIDKKISLINTYLISGFVILGALITIFKFIG